MTKYYFSLDFSIRFHIHKYVYTHFRPPHKFFHMQADILHRFAEDIYIYFLCNFPYELGDLFESVGEGKNWR